MKTTAFEHTDCFSLRDDLVVEQVDDEFLILDLRNNVYFGINLVGRMIWMQIQDRQPFGDIVASICTSFEVDSQIAQDDVEQFIGELLEHKLATRIMN